MSCLLVYVFVQQVADHGFDGIEALQFRPLAKQGGNISFLQPLDVFFGEVE